MSMVPYLAGAFIGVVGAGLGAGGFKARKKSKLVRAWPTAAGRLDSAELAVHKSSGTTSKGHSTTRVSYEPAVKYSYSVEGKEFKGKNIGLVESRAGKGAAESRIASLRSARELKVYYNPADPKEAYLDPKADGSFWMLFIGAALLALGIVVIYNAKMLVELFSF
jgi:hypothetical protein